MLRRLAAPLAMAYAATLHADEKVSAPTPPNITAAPEAMQAQWKEWRRTFRGSIPTEAAGADQFAEMVRDLRFRVSEEATLNLPLSFLIQETSDRTLSVSEERLAPLVRHSHLSRTEILKLATAARDANQAIERNEKETTEMENRARSLSPVMEHYERLGGRLEYQQQIIDEHGTAQAKLDPTLKELRELEALHAAKVRGNNVDAARFKQLSKRIGIHSSSEVSEARADLERIRAQHDAPIKKAKEAVAALTKEREELSEPAFHEACERYDSIQYYAHRISDLTESTGKLVQGTITLRSKTFGDLVKPEHREAFQYEMALVETTLTRREYTTLSREGNTSTAFVFDRDRSHSPVLFVATNEASTVIKATEQGENMLLAIEPAAPLHLRAINREKTVRNYINLNEELSFDDKGTVNALEPLHDVTGPSMHLHLCPGSRFDITGVRSSRRSIVCEGSGTIVLGARGQTPRDGIVPRIEVTTNRMPEPLVISIPRDRSLEEKHIDYDSFGMKLSLHADVSIAMKTSRFGSLLDKPGADVDIEVRGSKGNVTIPIVRDGKPVFDEARKVYERIIAVE
jgi:hypothetical protein